MLVSAYDENNKIVEGKLFITPTGNKIVLNENGHTNVNSLNYVRFVEDEDKDEKILNNIVKNDVEGCNEKTLEKTDDDELEEVGDDREKELKDAGIKVDDKEYTTKFVASAKAKVAIEDAKAGNISVSKALEKVQNMPESSQDIYDNLSPDYQDVLPYQDDKTRDEIYVDMQKEINDYAKENKKFDDEELSERLCNKYLHGKQVRGKSLKETFQLIVRNYR